MYRGITYTHVVLGSEEYMILLIVLLEKSRSGCSALFRQVGRVNEARRFGRIDDERVCLEHVGQISKQFCVSNARC